VVVAEAAMLDSRISGELLVEARRSGAKLVLAGDDRQLASIERGGLFGELRERHGSAVISQVTRQLVDWQRQAAGDLAEGRVEEAVRAFAREGAITWTRTQEEARQQLVERWQADTAADPAGTRFVFAYTPTRTWTSSTGPCARCGWNGASSGLESSWRRSTGP
jgi:ATP-dependent exoDNAse (exonuclease V) alpha subunit